MNEKSINYLHKYLSKIFYVFTNRHYTISLAGYSIAYLH